MSKNTLSATLGRAVVVSLALAPAVNAAENPFAMQVIAGSQHLAEAGSKTKEGKCGEGKCGASKMKEAGSKSGKMKEGGCSGSKLKEGGCSGSMKPEDAAPATKQ
jgi:uncharacterized low-complexity protein